MPLFSPEENKGMSRFFYQAVPANVRVPAAQSRR